MKVFNPLFTITIANKPKNKIKVTGSKVSRKCLAIVTNINGEFQAIINYNKGKMDITDTFTLNNEVLVLPFTENSLNLKDKQYVWLKNKDKYGHNVCIIRDAITANISPGIKEQYDAVVKDSLIVGHIVRINNKMYFEYEDLIAYNALSDYRIREVKIDESKPLFSK